MLVRALFILSLLLTSACDNPSQKRSQPNLQTQEDTEHQVPAGQLDESTIPLHYRLKLDINPRLPEFTGTTEIDVEIREATQLIWLHGKNLAVSSAEIIQDEQTITAVYKQRHDSGVASLVTETVVQPGKATLRIAYSAPFNNSSNALYSVNRGADHYAATQFQPIAARQVFPSFDEPRFKVPFDISVTATAGDVVVTTTPEVRSIREGDKMHYDFATTRPLPTYLLAFVVGPYDVEVYDDIPANSVRNRSVPLRGIAARGQGGKMRYALSHTAGLLSILETYFNIPYPYKKLDLIATPAGFGGAMENVGAIIYDEWLMLLDEQSSIDQRRAFFATHAHELAHMWFGDLVTPDWWTDIWLNESFATWMSYKTVQTYWPEGQFDHSLQQGALFAMANDSLESAREIREIVTHNDRITDSFDGITYEKGGGVLGMIEHYAGEENFRNGIRHHLNRYADATANAGQFMASLAQGAELSEIEPMFASFINQAGVPLVNIEVDCKDSTQLLLKQSRYAPLGSEMLTDRSIWQLPVCISGYQGEVKIESCHLMTQQQQSFDLEGQCPDDVFPNANGSGYYRFSLDDAGWQKLIARALSLSGGEALSLLDSLDAGFRAGTVSSTRYVDGLTMLARHQNWAVVNNVTGNLEELGDLLLPEDSSLLLEANRRLLSARYRTALAEGPEVLANRLQRFMLIIAREPTLRAPLAERAAAYIGFETRADPAAIEPGQLETTLSIGVQDLGEPYFDKLLELAIASEDPAFRGAAIGALARAEDSTLIVKLQSAIEAEKFRGTETTRIISRQMARAASRSATFDWLKSKPEKLLSMIPETFRPTIAPSLAKRMCSVEETDDWQNILEANEALIPGYQRSMRQVVEYNDLCAALRKNSRLDLIQELSQ